MRTKKKLFQKQDTQSYGCLISQPRPGLIPGQIGFRMNHICWQSTVHISFMDNFLHMVPHKQNPKKPPA